MQLPLPAPLASDLQRVEALVDERLRQRSIVARSSARQAFMLETRRSCAALCLIAAQSAGAYDSERVLHAAAAITLIHGATGVHNLLLDTAALRSGQLAKPATWDHGLALMVGDYLFALAASEMARTPDARVIAFYSEAVMRVCEGELAAVSSITPLEQALHQYRSQAASRSGALFEAAGKAGAVCGTAEPFVVETLGAFGFELGIACALLDDLLDHEAEPADGRETGVALRRQIITLPLIYAVAAGGADLIEQLREPEAVEIAALLQEIRRLGGLQRGLADLHSQILRAREQLSRIRHSAAYPALEALIDYTLARAERLKG